VLFDDITTLQQIAVLWQQIDDLLECDPTRFDEYFTTLSEEDATSILMEEHT